MNRTLAHRPLALAASVQLDVFAQTCAPTADEHPSGPRTHRLPRIRRQQAVTFSQAVARHTPRRQPAHVHTTPALARPGDVPTRANTATVADRHARLVQA